MENIIDVLITMPIEDKLIARVQDLSPKLTLQVLQADRLEDIPVERWSSVEVLYTDRIVPDDELAPNLRWIQFHWAGINHVLNEPLLYKPGLQVTTASGASASQVSEYVVMMMLALGRHLKEVMEYQEKKQWPRDRWKRFSPRELRDSTVGIVGYGSVGRQIARTLHTFGARILATKRNVMQPKDLGYSREGFGDPHGDYVHRLYPAEALRSMVKECDYVVISVPLTPATEVIINKDIIAAFKKSAYLIDVSRGGIVDHAALLQALNENKIAGAALDVFAEEPLPEGSPLWKMPNVLITPHVSGITQYYDQRAMVLFEANINRYLEGLPLYNLFNPEEFY